MQAFDLILPRNLGDALQALAQTNGSSRPLAGGTDVIVDLRAKRAPADVLVSLQALDDLRGVTQTNGALQVGASTRIAEFLKHPLLIQHDALRQAAFVFANPMIRNTATIGGNIGSASPAGDMLPPLLAFDARLELVGANGRRSMPLTDFFLAPRKTARNADEIISAVQIPLNSEPSKVASSFYKLGLRRADAISLISVAVWVQRDGDTVRDVRIALGAVAPRPMRALRAEQVLRGQFLGEANLYESARVASEECAPIDDLRASAKYRRRMVQVYVRRMLEQAWNKTQ